VQKYHPLIVWLIPRALELVPLLEKAVREGNEVLTLLLHCCYIIMLSHCYHTFLLVH
jgi:hypothetical protein